MSVKETVINFYKNNSINEVSYSKVIESLINEGTQTILLGLNLLFTKDFDDCINNKLSKQDFHQKCHNELKNILEKNKKQEKHCEIIVNIIPHLTFFVGKTKELLSVCNEAMIFQQKMCQKYYINNDDIIIKSMSQPHLSEFNNYTYDQSKMMNDNQFKLDTKENELKQGNSNHKENTAILVKTSLSEKFACLYFSNDNEHSQPKLFCCEGVAGTGKTETIKDQSYLAGYDPYIINCHENMQNVLNNILTDKEYDKQQVLIFDEFNRFSQNTIDSIMDTIKNIKKERFFRIGFTFNPGYAGRNQPDFKDLVVTKIDFFIPNLTKIVEVMLCVEGFTNICESVDLSQYLIDLHHNLERMISKKAFYDYGLRSIKAITKTAGRIQRNNPNYSQAQALQEAIHDRQSSMFHTDDKDIGNRAIQFDSTKHKKSTVQDILKIRHSLLFISSSLLGDNVIDVPEIHSILNIPKDKLSIHIFPQDKEFNKNIKSSQKDIDSFYSKDSDFVKEYKEASKNNMEKQFVLFNATGKNVENLNTVMDDNKLLCFDDEKIKLTENMRIIIVDNNGLSFCPATVSRCGVQFND